MWRLNFLLQRRDQRSCKKAKETKEAKESKEGLVKVVLALGGLGGPRRLLRSSQGLIPGPRDFLGTFYGFQRTSDFAFLKLGLINELFGDYTGPIHF